jgi:hypothetical protein
MSFLNNNNEDFLKTFKALKVKYNGSIILMKNGEGENECYETFLEDADFFIKYLGLNRISNNTDPSWVAFPKGALKELAEKITKYFNLIIVEPFDSDEEGFQLSINF